MDISTIVFGVIILALIVERYLFSKQMNKQLGDATRAVMSRNINEFLAATKDNKIYNEPLPDSEEVLLDNASEEVFDKYIKEQTK